MALLETGEAPTWRPWVSRLDVVFHSFPHFLLLLVVIQPEVELAVILIVLSFEALHLFVVVERDRVSSVPVQILLHLVTSVELLC